MDKLKYLDKILPLYGCNGVSDETSLFNKSTIPNWITLKNTLNNDMNYIKSIFSIKLLNLNRIHSHISTEQQSMALLRGLLKLAGISYTIIRTNSQEYMRLIITNKLLVDYIIHKNMNNTKVIQIPLNKDIPQELHKIVKGFYVKEDKQLKFSLIIGNDVIAKTTKLVYNDKLKMYEIKFFSEIINLSDGIPDVFMNALFFNLTTMNMMIYSKTNCDIYMEYYTDVDIIPLSSIKTYIKYEQPHSHLNDNIMMIQFEMFGMKYIGTLFKYYPNIKKQNILELKHADQKDIDMVKKHKEDLQEIKKV